MYALVIGKCPNAYHKLYTGHVQISTILLEAVALFDNVFDMHFLGMHVRSTTLLFLINLLFLTNSVLVEPTCTIYNQWKTILI